MTQTNWATAANGASASASSSYSTNTPDKMIDGQDDTWWRSNIVPIGVAEWVKIDLGQPRAINCIRFYQAINPANWVESYNLHYSHNNSDWSLLVEKLDSTGFDQDVLSETAARYWRIQPTTTSAGPWIVRDWQLIYDDASDLPQPDADSTVTELIRYVWENYYQDTFGALDTLFPTWDYDEMDCWHIAFHVGVWKSVLSALEDMGGGGAECAFDPTSILAAIDAHDTNMDTQLGSAATVRTTIATDATADRLAKYNGQLDALSLAQLALTENIDNEHIDTRAAVNAARDTILVNNNSQTSVLAVNSNANKDTIIANANGNLGTLTNTITSGLAQQTVDLAGPLATTHDELMSAIDAVDQKATDIQAIVTALSSNSGALPAWPGGANVDLLDEVVVTVPTELEISCDGVIVSVTQYAPGQSRQPAGDVTRYKGLGWVAFRSDLDDHENLIAISMSHQVICPQVIAHPTGLAVYCKPGTRLVLTPFLISAV